MAVGIALGGEGVCLRGGSLNGLSRVCRITFWGSCCRPGSLPCHGCRVGANAGYVAGSCQVQGTVWAIWTCGVMMAGLCWEMLQILPSTIGSAPPPPLERQAKAC